MGSMKTGRTRQVDIEGPLGEPLSYAERPDITRQVAAWQGPMGAA